jgi:hypothetical protein
MKELSRRPAAFVPGATHHAPVAPPLQQAGQ